MGQYVATPQQDVATSTTGIAAGQGDHLPIGDYGGQDYRSAIRFAVPPGWLAWTKIVSATLKVYISDHQHVAPRNSSIYFSRMNVPVWTKDQGSQDCESGFSGSNNTQSDDIVSSSGSRQTFSSGSTANAAKTFDAISFVLYYWANNSPLVFVFDNNGAGEYTELWSMGKAGTTYDAVLTINYEEQSAPTAPTPTSPGNGTTVLDDTPRLSWTHNDPQGDAQASAQVQLYDAGGVAIGSPWPVSGATNYIDVPTPLLRGTTYRWAVQTADAAVGYGPYCAQQSFTVKANPTVTIDATRYMDFNGQPRLRVKWSVAGGTQASYQVTGPSGYNSGVVPGGGQDHLLATLAITDNTPVSITVTVTTDESLVGSAVRSFTPRYGLTVHRRDLGAAPLNWGNPSVASTVPGGAQLIIEYGSDPAANAAPVSGWQASLGSVPKARYVFWRAWFIPSATAGPTLDRVTIYSDATAGKSIDKWYRWKNIAFGAPWAVDESEYVYGTRSVRVDPVGADTYLHSELITVKVGRSYILTGLMKSKGNSGAKFYLADVNGALLYSKVTPENPIAKIIESDKLIADKAWFDADSRDVNRYKTPVWEATVDTVYVICTGSGAVGTQAWFDALKLEESTVATPWSPASIGATVIDAGGVQIDGNKGGILRYKGTVGGARDVVEGGANGLLFGGDAPLSSDAAGVLTVPPIDGFGMYGLRAMHWVTGGGVCTLDGSSNFKWATRFIIIAQGNGADSAASGYYDIACPTSGTVVGVGGHANVTATAAGIPVPGWDALYVILPKGGVINAITVADFRIANYVGAMTPPPSNWVLLALRNGDDNILYVANGLRLALNQSLNVGGGLDVRGDVVVGGGLGVGQGAVSAGRIDSSSLINANGGLYDVGVRVIQPAGLRIQRGSVTVVGNGTAITAAGAITFSPAFSAAPILICTTDLAYRNAGHNGVPTAGGASVIVSDNRGSVIANGANLYVHWIAIGPA